MPCFEHQIHLHLPGKDNARADTESRQLRLDVESNNFPTDNGKFSISGGQSFRNATDHPTPRFFSWRPDSLAEATDAFLQNWGLIKGYANPPWNLVGRVLSKVEEQAANLKLVVSIWPSQLWYPKLLGLLVANPLVITPQEGIMVEIATQHLELTPPLGMWPISGNTTQVNNFQARLQTSCCCRGDRSPHNLTTRVRNGSAGILNS